MASVATSVSAQRAIVHGLLDSESAAGAFRFEIYPAQETSIEVTSFEDGFLRATIAQNTITGDTSIMIEDLTTALDAELSSEVAGLQPGSPDLAEFKSAAEVTPADLAPDAAGLIEGVGGDEVIGGKILCIIIFGGPEDPVGDAVCSAT